MRILNQVTDIKAKIATATELLDALLANCELPAEQFNAAQGAFDKLNAAYTELRNAFNK